MRFVSTVFAVLRGNVPGQLFGVISVLRGNVPGQLFGTKFSVSRGECNTRDILDSDLSRV